MPKLSQSLFGCDGAVKTQLGELTALELEVGDSESLKDSLRNRSCIVKKTLSSVQKVLCCFYDVASIYFLRGFWKPSGPYSHPGYSTKKKFFFTRSHDNFISARRTLKGLGYVRYSTKHRSPYTRLHRLY